MVNAAAESLQGLHCYKIILVILSICLRKLHLNWSHFRPLCSMSIFHASYPYSHADHTVHSFSSLPFLFFILGKGITLPILSVGHSMRLNPAIILHVKCLLRLSYNMCSAHSWYPSIPSFPWYAGSPHWS